MTAIVRVCTRQGFVIAADGRRRRTEDWKTFETISDSVQKIFDLQGSGRCLAYGLAGSVSVPDENGKVELDFATEAQSAVERLRNIEPAEFKSYVERFGRLLNGALRDMNARGGSRWPLVSNRGDGTVLNAYFVGYYFGVPSWAHLRLVQLEGKSTSVQLDSPLARPGRIELMGSHPMSDLLYEHKDRRFAQYIRPKPDRAEDLTLQEAIIVAENYIRACSEPLAAQIDPECAAIGGHVHSATITPRHGFRWVTGPVK
jgi:hypothetical protein